MSIQRFLPFLALAWLVALFLMGWSLFSSTGDESAAKRCMLKLAQCKSLKSEGESESDVTRLKEEIKALREKLEAARNGEQKRDLRDTPVGSLEEWQTGSSMRRREKLRRKILNGVHELWFYIRRQIDAIREAAKGEIKDRLGVALDDMIDQYQSIAVDVEQLGDIGGVGEWRAKEAQHLSAVVDKRLQKLQNPSDCSSARTLQCDLSKGCGFGCILHHVMYCMVAAYGTKRTFLLQGSRWSYSSGGWGAVFKPTSGTCSEGGSTSNWKGDNDDSQSVFLPIIDGVSPRPKSLPLAIPKDLQERLEGFHSAPAIWWMGKLARYLWRFTDNVQAVVEERLKAIGFKQPIVGVHVRRTDKINTEAAYHSIHEYMVHVKEFYRKLARTTDFDTKRVYLASDDPSVINDAQQTYPDYVFIHEKSASESAGVGARYSDAGLKGIIFDIEALSRTDFLSCTFSSQVCRLAYELMQPRQPDAGDRFRSLDDIYYFGGQFGHEQRAIYPHKARDGQIDLQVGDVIGIAGNHWDGYSKGTNHRTGRLGMYPSYKVEEIQRVFDGPSFDD